MPELTEKSHCLRDPLTQKGAGDGFPFVPVRLRARPIPTQKDGFRGAIAPPGDDPRRGEILHKREVYTMKFERLLDKIAENWSDYECEMRLSVAYRKAHGHCAYIDIRRGLSDEVAAIYHASESERNSRYSVGDMMELLDLDSDQIHRAYIAARALLTWYNRTQWDFCPSSELVDRLEKFVMG